MYHQQPGVRATCHFQCVATIAPTVYAHNSTLIPVPLALPQYVSTFNLATDFWSDLHHKGVKLRYISYSKVVDFLGFLLGVRVNSFEFSSTSA